jgi:hypothetical protein
MKPGRAPRMHRMETMAAGLNTLRVQSAAGASIADPTVRLASRQANTLASANAAAAATPPMSTV